MISPQAGDDDSDEYSLRPKRLREFIGQPKIKESLSIFLLAAQRRGEALDRVLLHGSPGLGFPAAGPRIPVDVSISRNVGII